MKALGFIFAMVVIGVGIILLPAIKTITDTIFNATLVSTMPLHLKALVGFWSLIVFGFFVYGAYILVKRGSQ